jgi:colanic acid biosynthesis protein WcaH
MNWIDNSLYEKIKFQLPIPCIDLLITHQGRLLLMLRNNQPGKDLWFTPGGRIMKGERLEMAAERILKEETGLTPKNLEQMGAMSHIWPNLHTVTILYRIESLKDKVVMNDEHRDYKWIDKITEELHPYLITMIKKANILNS